MACRDCDYKGFNIAPSTMNPQVAWVHKCPNCKDLRRYSDMVQILCGFQPPARGPAEIVSIDGKIKFFAHEPVVTVNGIRLEDIVEVKVHPSGSVSYE
jgi:hypothetical protein